MASKPINIDAIARQAQKQKDVGSSSDSLTSIDPSDLPLAPAGWNILIEPLNPKQESAGGIVIASEAQEVEEIQCCMGKVLACGPTALHGVTNSGVRLCELSHDISKPSDLVGKYVLFQPFTGHRVKLRKYEKKVIFLTAPEITGIVSRPEDIEFWL